MKKTEAVAPEQDVEALRLRLAEMEEAAEDVRVQLAETEADEPPRKRRMKANAKRRYKVRGGGDADAEGRLCTTDVYDIFPQGEVSRLDVGTFRKTGAVLWGHDLDLLPVGRATWIELDAEGWKLGWTWAENAFAQEVRAEWEAGVLTAMSVGMGVTFDADYEIERVALREASVVSVGADEGAYVAQWSGPSAVLASIRELADVRPGELTRLEPRTILRLAASLASVEVAEIVHPDEGDNMAAEAERTEATEQDVQEEQQEEQDVQEVNAEEPTSEVEPSADVSDGAPASEEEEPQGAASDPEQADAGESPARVEDEQHERLVASARDLVPADFSFEGATPNGIMRAALAWELGDETAAALRPVELAEQFGQLVERRAAAMAGLAKANERSAKVAEDWKRRNAAGQSGAAAGASHPAHQAMVAEMTSRWKGGSNSAQAQETH